MPSVFSALLAKALERQSLKIEDIFERITVDHIEALCLDDYSATNIRSLVDLADRLATRIRVADTPNEGILEVFTERFGDGVVAIRRKRIAGRGGQSHYEQNRELIISMYRQSRKNLSQTERHLKEAGVSCSRRWLKIFLEKWGEKKVRGS